DLFLANRKYFCITMPYLYLGPILGMLNRGSLVGSSLHNFSEKERGARIPRMYLAGRFPEIIEYVTKERNAALDLLQEGRDVLGTMGDQRRRTPSAPDPARIEESETSEAKPEEPVRGYAISEGTMEL